MINAQFCLITVGALLISPGLQSVAEAQLFGNRTTGSGPGGQLRSPFGSSGQRAAGGTAASLGPTDQLAAPGGVLDGNERFVRGNRSRQDFVGSGRSDLSGFVGSEQAIGVGRVPAATDNFRLEKTNVARINKPLPVQPATGMYYPKLVLELKPKTSQTSSSVATVAATPEVERRVKNIAGDQVQVSMAGDTAIVNGIVASPRMAELIVNLLSFEPGINQINNQLTVQ